MWVLLLILIKADGAVIAYDQGKFNYWNECRAIGTSMIPELDGQYIFACVELPTKEKE